MQNWQQVFSTIDGRDAWGTIRGYVYQVDVTIHRWLDLSENDVLELERGEDIDIVHRDLKGDELSRELQQLKFRQGNLSLNRAEIIEILKNYYLHRKNNPGHNLKFRFVTNSTYTIEKPAIFPSEKGIDAWHRLAKLQDLDAGNVDLIRIQQQLQLMISKQIIPGTDNLNDAQKEEQQSWTDFSTYLDDTSELIGFIKNFEWSFRNEDQNQVSKEISATLAVKHGKENAQAIYARLFLHLFKLLSTSGLKQIDKMLLDNLCRLPAISQADQQLLDIVQNLLSNLDIRVDNLEKEQKKQQVVIQAITEEIGLLQSQALVDFRTKLISTAPPVPLQIGTKRVEKVVDIVSKLQMHQWVHLEGINGCGKTQLAALVSERYKNCYWLDLREFNDDPNRSFISLYVFLQTISEVAVKQPISDWFREVVKSLPENTLLVINDLPSITSNEASLAGFLIELVKAANLAGIHLLTTGNHSIVPDISTALPANAISVYTSFNFTDDEIKECLVSYGAPHNLLAFAPLIAVKSTRNPRLVTAIIQRLQTLNWGSNDQTAIEILFDSEFDPQILNDVQASISRYITDDASKELLYRLSLVSWKFGNNELNAVSGVTEKIVHPFEKMQPLLNTWIQQFAATSFEISPLAARIGDKNLSVKTIKEVHRALGHSLLQGTVSQSTALRAIFSFIRGDDSNAAGSLLMQIYLLVSNPEEAKNLDAWGFFDLWTADDMIMPGNMAAGLRASLQVQQIRIYQLLEKDESQVLQSLESNLNKPDFPKIQAVIIRILLLPQVVGRYTNYYLENLKYVVENWGELKAQSIPDFNDDFIAGMLWIGLPHLIKIDDLVRWIRIGSIIPQHTGVSPFKSSIAYSAFTVLCNRILQFQPDNGQMESMAVKVKILELLEKTLKEINEPGLASTAIAARIKIEFTTYADPANADALTRTYIDETDSEDIRYILASNMGRLYFNDDNAKAKSRAKYWLEIAVANDLKHQDTFPESLIFLASAVSDTEPYAAIGHCERALKISGENPDLNDLDYIGTLAELTLSYWIAEDLSPMLTHLEELVERLYAAKEDNPSKEWIRLFQLSGHMTGYIASMLNEKRVPQTKGGDYFKPFQGMFYYDGKDVSHLYNAKNDAMLSSQVAFTAAGVHQIDRAYVWTVKSLEMARSTEFSETVDLLQRVNAQYTVADFHPREALDAYLYSGAITALVTGTPQERHEKLKELDVPGILSVKPSPYWDSAEDTTVNMAVIPLFIMVLNAVLDNKPEKNRMKDEYLTLMSDYKVSASQPLLWDLVHEISNLVFTRNTDVDRLVGRANTFGQQEKRHLQMMCIIGAGFINDESKARLQALINVMPYLEKLNKATKSIIEFCLVPYVKSSCKLIWEQLALNESPDQIAALSQIQNSDTNAIQTALQPLIDVLNPDLDNERRSWLYEYREI
ncbi:MAG TPA: hypothetical protein VIM55_10300 [Mucilaginibacter sp.]